MRLPQIIWAFLVRDFRVEASYRLSFLMQFGGLFISTVFWYFLSGIFGGNPDVSKHLSGLNYFEWVLGGLMASRFMTVAMESYASQIRLEQTTGTLEAMLVTPAKLRHLILASVSWSFLFAGIQAGLYLGFGLMLPGVTVKLGSLPAAFIAIALTVVAVSGIGILSAAFVLYFKRGNPITFLIGNLTALFGGVFIPPETLPVWLQWIAKVVPIFYAAECVRGALFRGETLTEQLPRLGALALFSLVLLPTGLFGARIAIAKAKREGSLIQY